jgi:N-acetylmuramoyl-L-alanine amidase
MGSPLDSSTFAHGACVAFAPTSGDTHKTVFLDAGHGGIDPGGIGVTASGQSVAEAGVNLAIELETMSILRSHGYRVVVSRTSDSTVVRLAPADMSSGALSLQGSHDDVAARAHCANLAHADALIGIYMDSGGSAQDAGSVALYDADRPFSAQSLQLAQLLEANVLFVMNAEGWQIPSNGVQPDTGFGSSVGDPSVGGLAHLATSYDHLMLIGPAMTGFFTTPSMMPGAVLEPLYLSDPFEGSIAANPADQHVIATALGSAIQQYLNPPKKVG